MKRTSIPALLGLLIALALAIGPALAADGKLFVNLTTDDIWRAGMALKFSQNTLKQGHGVTVFLNVQGVKLASTKLPQHTNGVTGSTPAQMLAAIIDAGGRVIVCPMCMKQAGIEPQDLVEGAIVGKPDITLPALFADDTRVISY
jgi:predicted peroxiredoxin